MFSSSLPKTILRLFAVLVLLSVTAWSFWQYNVTKRQLDNLTNQPDQAEIAQQERQELLNKVSQLMVLPAGENPLIFDIQNAASLAQSQPFFANAVDGDKLLLYPRAGRSILYSPSRNIVVNVGNLSVQSPEQLNASESTQSAQ